MQDLHARSTCKIYMLVAYNVRVETTVASALDTWSTFNALPCPHETDAHLQRSWDEPYVARDVKAPWKGSTCEMDRAWLLASKVPHSSNSQSLDVAFG